MLTADEYNFFVRYWFSAPPGSGPRSTAPLAAVAGRQRQDAHHVLTGEEDYRTPISESEQYYQALKLRKVDTALVRVPEAPHAIRSAEPARAKVAHILAWFEKYLTP